VEANPAYQLRLGSRDTSVGRRTQTHTSIRVQTW